MSSAERSVLPVFRTMIGLFFCFVLFALLIAQIILNSKLGRVTVALRGQEDRVRFTGYSVTAFKTAAFCFAAFAAGIGGAFFTMNVGFIHANFVGVVASIEMVIFCAVGGRFSIYGAVYGALIVNAAKTLFSEASFFEIPF